MQSFHYIEETLSLNMKFEDQSLIEKAVECQETNVKHLKDKSDQKACLKYLEVSAGIGSSADPSSNEHAYWQALE